MGMTATMWGFIAARLLSDSDAEAAKAVGINPTTVPMWKRENPDFAREYEGAFRDGVHVAQEISRKALGKASIRLLEALDAKARREVDHATRIAAAKVLYQSHGLLKERRVHEGDPDNPVQVQITGDDLHEAVKRAKHDDSNQ